MKVPRVRIAWVLIAVAIAALDFGAIRAMIGTTNHNLLLLGALPMANVLAVGILIGLRDPGSRAFVLGFEAFGAIAMVVYIGLVAFVPGFEVTYLGFFLRPMERIIGHAHPFVYIPVACFGVVLMLGWPQVAFALLGGSLFRRFERGATRGRALRAGPNPEKA